MKININDIIDIIIIIINGDNNNNNNDILGGVKGRNPIKSYFGEFLNPSLLFPRKTTQKNSYLITLKGLCGLSRFHEQTCIGFVWCFFLKLQLLKAHIFCRDVNYSCKQMPKWLQCS